MSKARIDYFNDCTYYAMTIHKCSGYSYIANYVYHYDMNIYMHMNIDVNLKVDLKQPCSFMFQIKCVLLRRQGTSVFLT